MFEGVITALVTPFRRDLLDEDALRRLVEDQIAAGVDGLVPVGTTGESPTLTTQEHIHVIEVVIEAAEKRVPVIAGTGSNSTHEAIELSVALSALNFSASMRNSRPSPTAGSICERRGASHFWAPDTIS